MKRLIMMMYTHKIVAREETKRLGSNKNPDEISNTTPF